MFGAEAFPKVSTGTDLVTSSSNAMMTTNSPGTLSRMSPMESVQELFVSMANSLQVIVENTTQTNELLKGTDAQRRDASLDKTDTDKDDDKGPSGPSFGDRLKSLNPFKEGLGANLPTFILALGALLGLKLFGDELLPSIAGLLESISTGKIGQRVKDALISFKEGFTYVLDFFEGIGNYINQFDVDDEKGLSPEEFDNLKEDVKTRTVDLISGFMGSLFDALKVSILGSIFLGTAVKSLTNNPALKGIFGSGKGFIGPRAPVPGIGIAGGLGIAALIAYGVTTTYGNFQKSMKKTLEENGGEFGMGDFIANFLGGKNDGGVMNAFTKAFEVGGTGALAGMAIGAVGGPPGMILGGLLGLATGALLGGVTGFLGSDKIKTMTDKFSNMISDTVDVLDGFFTGITESIRKAITGEATSFELDEQANLDAIAKEEAMIKKLLGEGRSEDSYAITRRRKNIEQYKKNISEITPEKIEEANKKKGERLTTNISNTIENNKLYLKKAQEELEKLLSMSPEKRDSNYESDLQEAKDTVERRTNQINNNELRKQNILKQLDIEYKIPTVSNTIENTIKNIELSKGTKSNAPGGAVIANNNNNNSINNSSSNHFSGGVDVNNNKLDTMRLIHKNMGR